MKMRRLYTVGLAAQFPGGCPGWFGGAGNTAAGQAGTRLPALAGVIVVAIGLNELCRESCRYEVHPPVPTAWEGVGHCSAKATLTAAIATTAAGVLRRTSGPLCG